MKREQEGGKEVARTAGVAEAAAVAGVKEDGQHENKAKLEGSAHGGADSKKNRFGQQHQARFSRPQAGFPGQHSFMNALRPQAGSQHGLVLSDNSEILKVINMNKMQHQYIQNLQKANMTLKCKIKEISELQTEQDYLNYQHSQTKLSEKEVPEAEVASQSDEFEFIDEDEEFQLQELGTIEEVSRKAIEKKRAKSKARQERSKSRPKGSHHEFYDRNSMSRKSSKYREEKRPVKDPAHRDKDSNYVEQARESHGSKRRYDADPNYHFYDRGSEKRSSHQYQREHDYHNYHNDEYYERGEGSHHAKRYQQDPDYVAYDRGHYSTSKYSHATANRVPGEPEDFQAFYLNRYQRMKKYGPYDEQARYPHDYFVYQKKAIQTKPESERADGLRRQESKKSYAQNYDEFDDFAEDEAGQRTKYQRERQGPRYFKVEGGEITENIDRKKGSKAGPQIWAGTDSSSHAADPNAEYRYQGKKKGRNSDYHQRPGKVNSKNVDLRTDNNYRLTEEEFQDPPHPLQKAASVQQPSQQVPAVLQVRQAPSQTSLKPSGGRDLRPAVFIKDLKKRSIALEEEKAQHFSDKGKPKHKPESNLQAALLRLQNAISSRDAKVLSN